MNYFHLMKIQCFKVTRQINGKEEALFPTLLTLRGKKYLVDCGYEETFPEFVSALEKLNTSIADLHAILISHDDIDHLGALKLFKDANPRLIIYCSEIEEPSVSGRIKSERLEQAEKSLDTMPEEYKPWALQFIEQLKNIRRGKVDAVLKDGDRIEDEVEVIFTPGHTKGHMSFYLPGEKTLIANDAIVVTEEGFDLANPMYTLDMQQAVESVGLIRDLNPETVICYHGGVVCENIPGKLAALIDRYGK